jgi:murein DD-endopeptidase MepM/ murein hydrolase activator NlpD
MTFETMNRLKTWLSNWRKEFKFAIYDPKNFNELFGFTTSKIRITSLVLLVVFFLSGILISLFLLSPLKNYFMGSDSSSQHSQITEQRLRVDSLNQKVAAQESYIQNMKRLMFGDFKSDSVPENRPELSIDPNTINPNPSSSEIQIGENVKADQYTNSTKGTADFVHFISPVKGKISQKFISGKHEAMDIVTLEDAHFSTCLSGTVVFSGYSQKDGNILIIEHTNDFLSIYKHAKSNFKKRGDKVRTGDIIGVVGNTGETSTGTHLHFELWLNQQAVNPEKYMKFD